MQPLSSPPDLAPDELAAEPTGPARPAAGEPVRPSVRHTPARRRPRNNPHSWKWQRPEPAVDW